jgi:hypothetical protein
MTEEVQDPGMDDAAGLGEAGDAVEMRPCTFCGAECDSRAARCRECGGNVALAWGKVLKEHFLFLFCSIFIAVGCVIPWDAGRPGVLYGTSTIRGSLMLGLALYGLCTAFFNILFRRFVVWPFFLNGVIALYTGLESVISTVGGPLWEAKKKEGGHLFAFLDGMRAIPPGMLMLTAAGFLVTIALLKGVIGGFMGGAAKAKAKQAEAAERRTRRREKGPSTDDAGAPFHPTADSGEPPPPPPPGDLPPPPP